MGRRWPTEVTDFFATAARTKRRWLCPNVDLDRLSSGSARVFDFHVHLPGARRRRESRIGRDWIPVDGSSPNPAEGDPG